VICTSVDSTPPSFCDERTLLNRQYSSFKSIGQNQLFDATMVISLRHVVYKKNTVVISAFELQNEVFRRRLIQFIWKLLNCSYSYSWKSNISEILLSKQKSSEFYIDIPSSNIVATRIRIIEWSNQFNKFEQTVFTTTHRDEFIIIIPVLREHRQQ